MRRVVVEADGDELNRTPIEEENIPL